MYATKKEKKKIVAKKDSLNFQNAKDARIFFLFSSFLSIEDVRERKRERKRSF